MPTKNAANEERKRVAQAVKDRHAHDPTYFLSLSVANLRCFGQEEQVLDLSDGHGHPAHWTVILGNNGTGKTTLLECLLAVEVPFFPLDELNAELMRESIPRYDRILDFRRIGMHDDDIALLQYKTATGGNLSSPVRKLDGHSGAIQIRPKLVQFRSFPVPTCYRYGVGRRMASTALRESASEKSRLDLFDEQTDLRNAEEWLLQLDYSATKKSPIQSLQKTRLQQVKKLLTSALPEVSAIRISNPTKKKPQPSVEFKTPDGWVPLRGIGFGYKTVLAWLVDLASRLVERYPDSKDPLSEPAVVLVDEIDLHLHPVWQRTLMGYLSERFPNIQFIVTAHSPLFVQAAEGANIVVLRREKDRVVIDNTVESIRGWRVDQVLTSDLFGLGTARSPRLENLLAQRRKILSKPKLAKSDHKKLVEIEEAIGPLPGGETASDAKTMKLLEDTLRSLKSRREGKRDSGH